MSHTEFSMLRERQRWHRYSVYGDYIYMDQYREDSVLNDPNYKNVFVKGPQMKNVKLTTFRTKDDVIMNIFAIDHF